MEDRLIPPPLGMIAELTHRCPLHCLYCSNPLELLALKEEVSTEIWKKAFEQGVRIGIHQVHLTGGEPLIRSDLEQLVEFAVQVGLYANLITSGVGLTHSRMRTMVKSGLKHVQLSVQGHRAEKIREIAKTNAFEAKLNAVQVIQEFPVALTINVVIHRLNIDALEELLLFVETLNPDKIEIAHTQYYGWALRNRQTLLPTAAQVQASFRVVNKFRERVKDKIRVDFVVPDYFASTPKRCMGGWGERQLVIRPDGSVWPCHSAGIIPNLKFDSIREQDLDWIWKSSPSFKKYRGNDWMPEVCRSCEKKNEDSGGCRCQAFTLAGDANQADPICSKSPSHSDFLAMRQNILERSGDVPLYREHQIKTEIQSS